MLSCRVGLIQCSHGAIGSFHVAVVGDSVFAVWKGNVFFASLDGRLIKLDANSGIDYYWTLLGYFNSIRELGGASSLVYGDIRERLRQIQNRDLVIKGNKRYINKIQELKSFH